MKKIREVFSTYRCEKIIFFRDRYLKEEILDMKGVYLLREYYEPPTFFPLDTILSQICVLTLKVELSRFPFLHLNIGDNVVLHTVTKYIVPKTEEEKELIMEWNGVVADTSHSKWEIEIYRCWEFKG